jgi:hypothetical protein
MNFQGATFPVQYLELSRQNFTAKSATQALPEIFHDRHQLALIKILR